MATTTIKIDGMSCQGCVKNITGVLTALRGVGEATVVLESAQATVDFDENLISREALCSAIEDAGFDAE